MSKLGKEQVMAAQAMVARGTSVRRVARQMGVTEGALRYRLKKRAQAEQPLPGAIHEPQHAARARA